MWVAAAEMAAMAARRKGAEKGTAVEAVQSKQK